MTASILVVEDTPSLATLYQVQLARAGLASTVVSTGQEAIEAISARPYDVLLLDLQLPDMSGHDVLQHLADSGSTLTTIMITAHGSVKVAIEAMRLGAYDFLMKPVAEDRLLESVQNALKHNAVQAEEAPPAPQSAPDPAPSGETARKKAIKPGQLGFVGSSPAMKKIYQMINSIARSQAAVFITGESGTGKEICAHAIHTASPRSDGPFIALNCAAIPRDLIESELFGHRKGAFTGATTDRVGAVFSANGGTLFLDEICEMDIALQSKLLRFLQTGQIQRVGDDKVQTVDIRVVCATNRVPIEEVAAGRFREDLYYRLHILALPLPPLRDRGADILELADFFVEKASKREGKPAAKLDDNAKRWLMSQNWPGNVRQLENLVHSMIVLNDGDRITADMLASMPLANVIMSQQQASIPQAPAPQQIAPPSIVAPASFQTDSPSLTETGTAIPGQLTIDLGRTYADMEREILEAVISLNDGSLPKAAKSLDMSPSTLYRKRDAWQDQDSLAED